MFEEQFDYKDEEKYSLRLHLLKGYIEIPPKTLVLNGIIGKVS